MTSPAPSLHQPKRALIAAGEVVAAVLLGFAAYWCWQRGVVHLQYPFDANTTLASTRYHGNWIGGAIALVTLAVIVVLDAVRQVVLAQRARPKKASAAPEPEPEPDLVDSDDRHADG